MHNVPGRRVCRAPMARGISTNPSGRNCRRIGEKRPKVTARVLCQMLTSQKFLERTPTGAFTTDRWDCDHPYYYSVALLEFCYHLEDAPMCGWRKGPEDARWRRVSGAAVSRERENTYAALKRHVLLFCLAQLVLVVVHLFVRFPWNKRENKTS